MLTKQEESHGKLRTQDQLTSRLLVWVPAVLTGLAAVPLPGLFLFFFLTAASTDSAAFYLLLSLMSLGIGLIVSLMIIGTFWFYRRRWTRQLRERLATDGITAAELSWFHPELSSEEKKTWRELKTMNPLLAEAYAETLAARLTATRIAARARRDLLRIERQLTRARGLLSADTASLVEGLMADREQTIIIRQDAQKREVEATARLQSIDAVARRGLNQTETGVMLHRLRAAQSQIPLGLEIAELEQEARKEIENSSSTPIDSN
ncbi:MAG TPA: hypothetical protein VJV03_17270 [Pyrinomonadaceae bacterium]|nr:hypothetical protein [Pyrinomonadaceae bacterium]